jgi:hypothetical protein
MYVETDLSRHPAALALLEPDDFKSLKVVVHAPASRQDDLAQALAPVGAVDAEGNALLAIDALKRLAGDRADDPQWLAGFDAMVRYARTRGWVDAGGTALQAHCEFDEESRR